MMIEQVKKYVNKKMVFYECKCHKIIIDRWKKINTNYNEEELDKYKKNKECINSINH